MNLEELISIQGSLGHEVFTDQSKPYNLNIVGLRLDKTPNEFNDKIFIYWRYNNSYSCLSFKATTDPGLYWLNNPMNINGTAIVVPGQYKGLWKIGKHQGKYDALVQKQPIKVYRDNDKDSDLDEVNVESGMFGINCHRAFVQQESVTVNKWSAGCQVIANPKDFSLFMNACENAVHYWGNSFTYTLIDLT